MRNVRTSQSSRLGLVHPALDAHTLGISSIAQLLEECGFKSVIADTATCRAVSTPDDPHSMELIQRWLADNGISVLGFSYRLDQQKGAALFASFFHELRARRLLTQQGGRITAVYFAGLPGTCDQVLRENPDVAGVFRGDETPAETLQILGVAPELMPRKTMEGIRYDEDRLSFGRDLIRQGNYLKLKGVNRNKSEGFGTADDTVLARIRHGVESGLPPLMRAHVGPYLADRDEALQLFLQWVKQLGAAGFLDVLSIGTSQLSQSSFSEDWDDQPNGGGVPLNSRQEFESVWNAARPMLVRTYAGTSNIRELAQMYEETIHISWHALSLWWFCRIDGRGPYTVGENLRRHLETMRYIASTGKPFEANVSHHFAFRGADDVTYVVSAVIAARMAKAVGIRHFILQNMLNTPKYTWGVQDLAKSRVMLQLVRELEDDRFHVILQPRGGLDYFSHDCDKAKAQLAAVTALMDDIEPDNPNSPPIIHVVSYSEANHLADPPTINESIQITRYALERYRKLRSRGEIDDMADHPEVAQRADELLSEARLVLKTIESLIPNPYTAEGLYRIFAEGFLPVPYLWECRDEFCRAMQWQTRVVRGSVKVVDQSGVPVKARERMHLLLRSR